MKKMKQIMSVLLCSILVLAINLPVSAEIGAARATAATTTCSTCGATASFSRYGKFIGYRIGDRGKHEEGVEAFYYCPKGHATIRESWIERPGHIVIHYTDLGHTTPASDTHQYWITCFCGHQENIYVSYCDYNKTGVHTKPF